VVINGQTGTAPVIQVDGRSYVDLGTLVQIAGGSLNFGGDHIILTLPSSEKNAPRGSSPSERPAELGLSRDFVKAAIEEIALLREWASPVANAIQNGFPVSDSWVASYRDKAADGLSKTALVALTAVDQSAFQLLTNEFANVREWSNAVVEARKSMDTAKYALSPGALRDEPMSQKIITCAQFLATMLANGNVQDDASCH
jgi:hypothetical protein